MEARLAEPARLSGTRARIDELAAHADPHQAKRNVREAEELLGLALIDGADDEVLFNAYELLLGLLLEDGNVAALFAHISDLARRVPRRYAERQLAWFHCARAVMDGTVDHRSKPLRKEVLGEPAADAISFVSDWWSGHLGDVEQRALKLRRERPDDQLALALVARIWAEQGRLTAARGALAHCVDVDQLESGRHWLLSVSLLAETAVLVQDWDRCEIARDALTPHAHRLITMGGGSICWGAVNRPMALLAEATGRSREAEAALCTLIDDAAYAGAQPWLIQAQLDLIELTLRKGRHLEAAHVLSDVESGLESVRLAPLTERYYQLLSRALRQGVHLERRRRSALVPLDNNQMPQIRAFGGFVVHDVSGREVEWNSQKARRLLRYLIARRGAPVCREEAMRMLWPEESVEVLGNRLAVAITAIRKALDPDHSFGNQYFVRTTLDTVQLRIDRMAIDVFEFCTRASTALEHYGRASPEAERLLTATLAIRAGEVFADEPYDDTGESLRFECHVVRIDVLQALMTLAQKRGQWHLVELRCRELLDADPCNDLAAHVAIVLRERNSSSIASGVTSVDPPESTMRP